MRSPLAYAPRPGPLSAASAVAARASTSARSAVVAFIFSNPIVLAGAGAAVVVAGLLAGAGAGAARGGALGR